MTNESKANTGEELPRVQPSPGYKVPVPQNWCADHYDDDLNPPIKQLPTPLTETVSESNPLEFDFYISLRSPYSYLVLDRILALNATYNVKITTRPLLPIAIRVGFPGIPWYRWNYDMIDAHRVAKFMGIPFRRPHPEPIIQNTHPPYTADLDLDHNPEHHPNIHRVVRCAAAAQMQGKGLDFLNHVMRMMWDGQTDNWPEHLVEYMERAGLDGKAIDEDVAANPDKYDAVLNENAALHNATGHSGVPIVAFRGEPFFGQDRFDVFFWRLQQNGLTKRNDAPASLPTQSWT